MDTEFHYWLTGLIAKRAGFTDQESHTIAYASEYVDENDITYYINTDSSRGKSKKQVSYSNYISQTMDILKPKSELMRVYPIFHFLPGDPMAETAYRRDGMMHLLNTTPNSQNANELLDAAFKSGNDARLYRIGIATHAYVDTWAHQNFVGWYDYFNRIGMDPKPNIGHADGERHPDWVSHNWEDERLVESYVSNRTRFIDAAEALFNKYCHYIKVEQGLDNSGGWQALEQELIDLMGPTYSGSNIRYRERRLDGYRKQIPWLGGDFDERSWFDAAIDTDVRGLRDSKNGIGVKFNFIRDEYYWRDEPNRTDSDWYKFQEAVKEHEKTALTMLSETFSKMGIVLAVS